MSSLKEWWRAQKEEKRKITNLAFYIKYFQPFESSKHKTVQKIQNINRSDMSNVGHVCNCGVNDQVVNSEIIKLC
jgi:hypothetical protein